MFRKSLALGIVSGLLAGVAGIVYSRIYYKINESDYSEVVNALRIIAASLIGGVLAAMGYTLLTRLLKNTGEIIFNLCFTLISFASLLIPIATTLPKTVDPALFPGLVIPMHFFPALGWYTLKPIFIRSK